MASVTLEERMRLVETELERLKAKLASSSQVEQRPGWERIIGTFTDSEGFDEAVRLGRGYRESLRPTENAVGE